MQILLETQRLILRRFEETDLDHLVELDNDPEVMRFINGGIATPRKTIQNEILPGFLSYDERLPEFGFWAAQAKSTLAFIGWFSFRPLDRAPEVVELGYRLLRYAWGNGYATEGVDALIRLAFTELDVERVIATTYEQNRASRRVMERVGMRLAKTFRITSDDLANAETYHSDSLEPWDGDDVEYALEKSQWRALGAVDDPQ